MTVPRKIELVAADGGRIEVEGERADDLIARCATLRNMLEDLGPDVYVIPVPNVASADLARVLETWDKAALTALADRDSAAMNSLILAANFLDDRALLDACLDAVAAKLRAMTPDEIREYLGLENDFTPEEEEKLRLETVWVF